MRTTKPIFLCASQSSTAICMSMDHHQQPSSSSSSVQLGGRAIDRHNPIIRDGRRFISTATAPCSSSQLPPINPKPYHQLPKTNIDSNNNSSPSSNSSKPRGKSKKSGGDIKKKKKNSTYAAAPRMPSTGNVVKKKSFRGNTLGDFITPPGSSRYLLGDTGFLDGLSDNDPVLGLAPVEPKKQTPLSVVNYQDKSTVASKLSTFSSRSEKPTSNQVRSLIFSYILFLNNLIILFSYILYERL